MVPKKHIITKRENCWRKREGEHVYLNSGESLVKTTNRISVSFIPFDALLTNERLILLDNEQNRIPPQVVPLADIFSVKGGSIPTGEPVITITLLDPENSGTPIHLDLIFAQRANERRFPERDDWLRTLMQNLVDVRQSQVLSDLSGAGDKPGPREIIRQWIAPEILYPAPHVPSAEVPSGTGGGVVDTQAATKGTLEPAPESVPGAGMQGPAPNEHPGGGISAGSDTGRISQEKEQLPEKREPVIRPRVDWPVIPEPRLETHGKAERVTETAAESDDQDKEDHSPLPVRPGIPRAPQEIHWPVISGTSVFSPAGKPSASGPSLPPLPVTPDKAGTTVVPGKTANMEKGKPEVPVVNPPATRKSSETIKTFPANRTDAKASQEKRELPERGHHTGHPSGNIAPGSRKILLASAAIGIIILVVIGAFALSLQHPAVTTPPPPTPVVTQVVPVSTTAVPPVELPPQTGLWLVVDYPQFYYGDAGNPGGLQEVSGTGRHIYEIRNSASLVQADIQKQDNSGDTLSVAIYLNGTAVYSTEVRKPMGSVRILIDPTTGKAPV